VPVFPTIDQVEYAAKTITPERLLRVLAAIPWERRGVFLVMAFEQLRVSEAVALKIEDWDGEQLHIHASRCKRGRGTR
jgi:integrase